MSGKHVRLDFLIAFTIFLLGIFSCRKEEFYEGSDARLVFSVDTVMFDTVFTTIGTTTKWLKVYNPQRQPVRIESIHLAGSPDSNYRINVDGTPGPEVRNVTLRGRDSLFIFVEATIDPANQDAPLVVEDSILFSTNGNLQQVKVLAWGQDVNLIKGEILQTQTWTAGKPYLVYNSMLVDSGHILTIEAGTRIFFHRNSTMYVEGTVRAMGNPDNPVIFQGDRLEAMYRNIPGQWNGIWLLAGSENNEFHYAQIRNAVNGIIADTLTASPNPTLYLANAKIQNMTSAGIYARGTSIYAYNCEITNCGRYAIALTIGGSYEFYHCTIANYWNFSHRNTPSVVLNNYYLDIFQNLQIRPLDKAIFGNCIIHGNRINEIGYELHPDPLYHDYLFDHCLLRLSEANIPDPLKFTGVIFNKNPDFESIEDRDFSLGEASVAINAGRSEYAILHPLDFSLKSRMTDIAPDLGPFERQN